MPARPAANRAEVLEQRSLLSAVWVAQGPATSQNGQVEGIADGEVIGAVHAVLTHPTDANTMYIGSVNGGVWKTTNATAADPNWTPMFDQNSSMSIGALAMDPTNPDRVVAGFGRYSSYLDVNNGLLSFGGNLTGVAVTSNGGDSWTEINDPLLQGESISGVAIRGDLLLAASNPFVGTGGLYRRADAGSGFILVSGATYPDTTPSGLPVGGVFDLAGDPTNANRFYASVASQGLYRSDDAGLHWTLISGSDATLNTAFTSPNNNNAEMSVASNGRVFVGVILNGRANYLGYSDDQGGTWTAMDLPRTQEGNGDVEGLSPREKPGSQGIRHFSIVADPNDPNTVYVGGDRQDSPFPNFIGATDFTARLFRGDTTVAPTGAVPSPQWEHLTHSNNIAAIPGGGTGNGSAPHADSRDMAFDANGNLIEVDDGGIYRRTSPQNNAGDWFSIIGDLAVTEMHNLAYDSNTNTLISGNQDTGTTYQFAPGGGLWNSLSTADGGDVAVDTVSRAGSGQSIRYSSRQNLGGFQRTVWDASNTQVTVAGVTGSPTLNLIGGGAAFVAQFVTPVVLNEITPARLVIGGGNSVYESTDQGNTITEIGAGIVADAIAYGGRSGGANNADVLYVGQVGQVFVRTTAGGALTATTALPAGIDRITDIELDPNDWNRAWIVDSNQVFQTTDAGASWLDVTGNLVMSTIRSIEYAAGPVADALLVGGLSGVFKALSTNFADWSRFGIGIPNTLVWDLDYNATDDLLAAGTLGRGAWTVSAASTSLVEPDRFEGNETQATAVSIGAGGGVHLSAVNIHLPTDQDWYRFDVLRQDDLDISTVFSQTDGDLNFDVVDASGNVLGSATTYSGDRKTVSLTGLAPGSYFVHVSAADTSTTEYRLDITPGATSTTRVFYVNDSSTAAGHYALAAGNDANDGLSASTPKATVQDVLDDHDIGPNDLIVIDTGNYSVGMSLTADDEGAAYAGTTRGSVFSGGSIFDLADADGNIFYGLTFSSGGTAFNIHGVNGVSDSNDNLIRNNRFEDRSTGVVQTSGTVNVVSNTFVDVSTGVSLNTVTGATISQNAISEETTDVVAQGIAVANSSGVTLHDNNVSGAGLGLSLHNSTVSVTENELSHNGTGAGITFGSVSLTGNHIHHNTFGVDTSSAATIIGGTDWSAASFNEIDHNTTGVRATHETTIHFNRLHRNATAIQAIGGSEADPIVIDHNVIFRNTTAGVVSDGSNGTQITSNTIYAPSGDGVRVQNFSQNVELRNNIIWTENGYGVNVATNSQAGFESDYNNLFATRDGTHDGKIVFFQKDFTDLFDWQVEANYDNHSIGYTVLDPTLDNPQFVNLAADDYRLTDLVSTSLDAGDPGITVDFSGEPDPDGGRLNLGAYGNTPDAGLSRANFLEVDFPNYFTDLVPDVGSPILFHAFNITGNVDIDLLDAAGDFVQDIATVAAADGATTWTPSLSLASVSARYRIRVRSVDNPSIEDVSREPFSVPPVGTEFFVDNGSNTGDQYTPTAIGNNRNTGRTANDPKASLIALLRSYDLEGADTVFVDAGNYVHVRNIVLSGELTVGNDEGMTITGPSDVGAGPAVLDRANPFAGSTNIELNDADFVAIRHLTMTGARDGLFVHNGSTNFHGEHLIVSNNAQSGIRIESDSEGTVVDALSAFGNGTDGISILTPISQLLNSTAHDNGGTGITIAAGPADGTLFVSNIEVFNNAGGGLNVSASGSIDLTELDVHNNNGTGLSISAGHFVLTNSQFVSNGFGVSASAGSATTSVIGSVNASGVASLAANDPGASSGERGNIFTGNTGGGVSASGSVLVFGNSIVGSPGSAGTGISLTSATAEQNVVQGYSIGIAAQNSFFNDVIRRNRVFNNSAFGITASNDDEVSENVVYSNGTGIQANGSPTIQNNVIYDNDVNGIFLAGAGGNAGNRPLVLNNTVVAATGNAVRIEGHSNFVELRNNILSVQSGFDISVANDSQVGFQSDYNVLHTSGTGKVAFWQGLARPTIGDWRLTAFTDQHSLASDPLFAGTGTTNTTLGFVNAANDGTDDDFHLKSTVGRFTGGLVPTVQGSANGLPQAPVVTETTDGVQSPAIDRGADDDAFNLEPAPNGGFINLGAFGNTTQASKSPAEYILLTVPDGGEIWPAEQTFHIEWRSQVTGVFGGDTQYRDEVLTDSPQGYWRLNEASGTVADDLSSAGQDGTYEGTVELGDPSVFPTITAATFGSSDDVVTVPDHAGLNGETLSVEAWIFPTGQFGSYDTVLMKTSNGSWSDGYGLYLSSDNTTGLLHFFINNYSTHEATANVPLNQWSHVVGTYDGSAIKLHVNGVLVGSTAYSEAIVHSTGALRIGSGEGGYPWRGSLGDVAVYNAALSATQVADHYSRNPSSAGEVDIELIQDGSANTVLIADDTSNDGLFTWTVPNTITPGTDYRIRLTHSSIGGLTDSSNNTFEITEPIHEYYVNIPDDPTLADNEYTTASGSNANTGFFPSSPKASIQAVLDAYDLAPGDVIYVDTGLYTLTVNITIGHEDSGIVIQGPTTAGRRAVLDRDNQSNGSYVVELNNADSITLDYLALTGGYHGFFAGSGSDSDNAVIAHSEVYGNSSDGIHVQTSNDAIQIINNNAIYDNGPNGVFLNGNGTVANNVFYGNSSSAISASTLQSNDVLTISGNRVLFGQSVGISVSIGGNTLSTVSGNIVSDSGIGISAYGTVLVSGNTVFENSVGISISIGEARGNTVYRNSTGIASGSIFTNDTIVGNRVFDNADAGIRVDSGDTADGNQVYDNPVGIRASAMSGEIRNNLIYRSTTSAILLEGGVPKVVNNTIYEPTADGIVVVSNGTALLRNNLISVGEGYAVTVSEDSQNGFASDYNFFQFPVGTSEGGLGLWQDVDFDALSDWFFQLDFDQNSLTGNPLFSQIGGTDTQLGFSNNEIGAPIIVDDGVTTGTWTTVSGVGRDGDTRESTNAGDFTTFTFTGLTAGATYDIATTWTRDPAREVGDYSNRVGYEVRDGGTTLALSWLSHQTAPTEVHYGGRAFESDGTDWLFLETVTATGTSLTVRVKNLDGDRAIADAVRLQQIAGDHGADDDLGFRVTGASSSLDNGDPLTVYSSEPAPNGNRVNLGADGNTTQATLSSNPAIQILSQNGFEKLTVGESTTVTWQSAGLRTLDPVLLVNGGSVQAGRYVSSAQLLTAGSGATVGELVSLSGVTDPAPQAVYQSFDSVYGIDGHVKYELPLPDGEYTLRVHFVNATSGYGVEDDQSIFDIRAEGNLLANDLDLFDVAGGANHGGVSTFTVNVSGGDGLTLDFINATNTYLTIAGLEVLRTNATGIADPRADIDVSLDNGANWTTIASNQPFDRLGGGSFHWTPDTASLGMTALVRVTSDATSDVSNHSFLIAPTGNHFYVNDSSTVGDVTFGAAGASAVGNDLNSGMSLDQPVASLIGLLNSYDFGPGDVIHVNTGDYLLLRNLVIGSDDAGVRIEGPTSAVAQLRRGTVAGGNDRVIEILNANDVTISHLTLTDANTGVRADGSDGLELTHLHVVGFNVAGIDVNDATGAVITDNIAESNGTGIIFNASGDGLSASSVSDNVAFGNGTGISFYGHGSVTENRVFSNSNGLYLSIDSIGTLVASDNTVSSNHTGIVTIYGVQVSSNDVFGNSGTGIVASLGGSLITDNNVWNNHGGIATASQFASDVVRGNRVYHNTTIGILANANDVVDGNQIYGNATGVEASHTTQVTHNLIYDNADHGVLVSGGSLGMALRNNTIGQPVGDAVRVQGSSQGVLVENNILTATGGFAISVEPDSQVGFVSDYNVFQFPVGTVGGGLGEWQTRDFDTLTNWRFELGLDRHSRVASPNFTDANGVDDIAGYSTASVGSAQIIDNGGAGFSTVGAWNPDGSGLNGGELISTATSESASWQFTGLVVGATYELAVTWLTGGTAAAGLATYFVFDGSDLVARPQLDHTHHHSGFAPNDFSADGADWERLGTLVLGSTSLTVTLTPPETGTVYADAVRLQRIEGNGGVDDVVGYRLPSNSPAIDNGNPLTPFTLEPQTNGNRVNIGHQGGTTAATLSPASQVQLVSPNGQEKLEAGSTVPIQWQIAGIGTTDPVAVLNVGGGQAGFFSPDQFQTAGTSFASTTTETINTSGADLPAPAQVYQSWKSAEYGEDKHLTFHLPIADGTYTVRLHFAEPFTSITAADRKFDIVLNGDTAADDFDIFSAAGGVRRAVTRTFTVEATGGEGVTVDLVNETLNEALLSGLEVLRQNASGQSDPRATLELSTDNGSTWSVLEDDLPHDRFGHGEYLWTVPANVVAAGDVAQLRVSVNPTDVSDGSFLIVNGGHNFYVNDSSTTGDVFTTAVGNDLNGGKTPGSPMANLAALLDAYDLGPGDVIHVDTGNYLVLRNIVIGADDAGVRIEGPAGETVRAILDRDLEGQSFSHVFDVVGADHVTIDSLGITGAYEGLVTSEGSDHLTVSQSKVFGNATTGIRLDQSGHAHRIEDTELLSNGTYGLFVNTDALVKDNHVSGQGTGIFASNFSAELLLEIQNNTVTGNTSVGIDANSHVLVTGNTVAGQTTGINVYFGAEASHNVVFGNQNGIVSTAIFFSEERIFGNRVFFNSAAGIVASYLDVIDSNSVYSNSTGISLSSYSGLVANNLVYANSNFGIVVSSSSSGGPQIINNSVFQDVGDALRFNGADDAQVFNNILWINAGRAIFVDASSQSGFTSNRNVITRGPNPIAPGENAFAGFFNGATVVTLADWQVASGQDLLSFEGDVEWIDINGADNVLGYSTAGVGYDGGADDNFGLFRDSPAIDRADGDVAPDTDFLGAARHDDPGTPNTGVGDPLFADIGAFEFLGDSNDVAPPTVLSTSPVTLHAGGNVSQARRAFTITFSEPLNAVDARASTNFSIRSPGLNGSFDEIDDVFFPVTPSYTLGSTTATVTIPDFLTLGTYRLTISGDSSIHDNSANKLDGDNNGVEGGDYVREFTIVPNNAPTADDDSASTAEDTDLTLAPSDLLTGDNDPDDDPLSIVLVTGPAHGTLTPTEAGGFIYSPDDDYFGNDSFTYRATDGLATSNLATVTLTITAVNDAPIAVNDAYDVGEDGDLNVNAALGVLDNDSDVDTASGSLTVTLVENQGVQNGQLTLNTDGSLTYSPNDNFFGTDSFTYRVSDGDKTDEATVTITVLAVNDVPVAVNESYQIGVDAVLEVSVFAGVLTNDSDHDFDPLTAVLVSDAGNGVLDLNADGSFTYTPDTGFSGTDSFTYKANDGTQDSNTVTVTIVVDTFNAEIRGVKFHDLNSDGVRDPGTPAVPGDVALFNWQAIASVLDLNSPLFGDHDFQQYPYTILNGGQGLVEILSGFEIIAAELIDFDDLTFEFGDTTDPFDSSAPGLVLDDFDNGLIDGIAKQFFRPESGVTDNAFRLFNNGVLVASGVIQEVVVETNTFLDSHGHGRVLFTTAGADPTIFNEIVSLSGGTGILEFSMSSFDFDGVVTGVQDGSLFLTNGFVTNLGDDGAPGVPGETLLGGFTIVAFQDLDDDGVLDDGTEVGYYGFTNFSTGEYAITDLPAGTYLVQELPVEHWTQTLPNAAADFQYVVTLTSGQIATGKDFGNLFIDPMTSEIHGIKWNDLNGNGDRDGVGSTISEVLSTTDDVGGLNPDSITVYLAAGDDLSFDISVTVPEADDFMFVEITGDNHFVVQDITPSFFFDVTAGSVLTFTVTLNTFEAGFSDSLEISLFGLGTTTVHITTPELEPLLAGWTIFLDADEDNDLDEDGDGILEAGEELFTTTNANGEYSFTGLSGGVYSVREVLQSGWEQTSPGAASGFEHFVILDPEHILTAIDFGNQLVNFAPTATADSYEVAEDGTLNGSSVLANDDDLEEDDLTAILFTDVSHGTLDLNSDGTFTYEPADNFNGIDSFSYRAFDGFGHSSVVTVTITITAVNDAPTGVNDPLSSVAEDSGLRVISFASLLDNDVKGPANEHGQTLTITSVSNPIGGTVAINGSNIEFTPTEHFNGAASFTYTLRDNGTTNGSNAFLTSTANVSFTITEVNDVPTGVDDSLSSVAEDSGVRVISFASLLGNDVKGPTNEHGQTLTITSVSNPVGGTVAINGSDIEFTPTEHFNGAASFTYTLSDNGTTNGINAFLTSTAIASFAITEVNDAPAGVDDPLSSVAEDSGVRLISIASLLGNDVKGPANENGQVLTITAVSDPIGGTVAINGTDIEFTPTEHFNGAASFTYTLRDNGTTNGTNDFLTSTAIVSFTITEVNDAPAGVDDSLSSVTEDSGVRVISFASLLGNDVKGPPNEHGQTLTITAASNPIGGTVAINGSNVEFTPTEHFNGAASFTYTLSDNGTTDGTNAFLTSTATASFTITEVNDAPTGTNDDLVPVLEDSAVRVISFASLLGNDVKGPANENGQALTITGVNNPVGGTVSMSGTNVEFTPTPHFNGAASFTYTLRDNGTTGGTNDLLTSTANVSFTITAVNDVPSFSKGENVTTLGDGVQKTFAGWATNRSAGPADESGQMLDFVVTTTNATFFTVAPAVSADGTLTYTPKANTTGTATVTIHIHDNGGIANGGVDTSASQTFTITLAGLNKVPVFTKGANQTVLEDAAAQTVNWATAISAGLGEAALGQQVDFVVTNNNNAMFSVPPTISPTGVLTYTPAANASGTATVSVQLHDDGGTAGGTTATNGGKNLSAVQTFTIVMTPVNDVPSFTLPDTEIDVPEDVAQSLAGFAANLHKGVDDALIPGNELSQTLSFVITNDNAALFKTAPAISATGVLTFTPAVNAHGTATLTVRVKDNGGITNGGVDTSVAQVFTINVLPTNDAPSFTKGANQTALEDVGPKTVANWATKISSGPIDEAGQLLEFLVTTSNDAFFSELPEISPTGTLTYETAPDASGVVTVTVRLRDDGGTDLGGVDTSLPQTFTITATAVNDLPTLAEIDDLNTDEDTAIGPIDLTIGDLETPAASLKLSATSSNVKLIPVKNIVFSTGSDRTMTITPAPNLFGTATITVKVTDANNGVAQRTFIVTVDPVNDAPPTITVIADVAIDEDKPTAAIAFKVDDVDDKLVNLNALAVTVTSSNTDLVPEEPANITLGGSAGSRTIKLTPLLDQFGVTTITVTVTDTSGASTEESFLLTVRPINDAPRVTVTTFAIDEYTTNDTVVGIVEAVDPEDDAVTSFAILGGNTGNAFKINSTTGEIRVNDATKIDFETLATYNLTIKATDALGAAGVPGSIPTQIGPVIINVTNQSFDFTLDLPEDAPNSVTISKLGNNLVVPGLTLNVPGLVPATPVRLEDIGIVTINGGAEADTLILNTTLNSAGSAKTIVFKGKIVFNGGEGDDVLTSNTITVSTFRVEFDGGAGNDTASAGAELNTLLGGDDNDILNGGAGDDLLDGGAGDDALTGGKGNDSYLFAAADSPETDTVRELGSEGNDKLDFSALSDAITVNLSALVVAGSEILATHANRIVKTSVTGTTKLAPNFENVTGGDGDDSIVGNAAANTLLGGAGNDTIRGVVGNDSLEGNGGDDFLFGDDGNDTISGGADNDVLVGDVRGAAAKAGNDLLKGDAGEDSILGGLGTDHLQGGDDDDLLFGEEANDTLTGGNGADSMSGGAGSTNLTDFVAEIDLIGAFTSELNALLTALP